MNEFIEKLIGRLEEEENDAKCRWDDDDYYVGQANAYEHTIAIVNTLAEEYNNYFCEWHNGTSGIFKIKTKCGNSIDINYGYNYCPYCGKKIKIAPYQPKGEQLWI